MRFHAYHGVLPQEKIIGGDFAVNLLIEVDLTDACNSDDVDDTINYADVYDLVKEEMNIASQLLEHIAGRIYRRIIVEYPKVLSLEVAVAKLNPPINGEMEKAEIVINN